LEQVQEISVALLKLLPVSRITASGVVLCHGKISLTLLSSLQCTVI